MRWLWELPGRCAIFCIRCYQRGISPLLGANCRFQPLVANTQSQLLKSMVCCGDFFAERGEFCVATHLTVAASIHPEGPERSCHLLADWADSKCANLLLQQNHDLENRATLAVDLRWP